MHYAIAQSSGGRTGDAGEKRWISYFLHLSDIDGGRSSSGVEWRLYQPETEEDVLVLSLPEVLLGIVWDVGFEWFYYTQGGGAYRAAWKLGTQPEKILDLPEGVAAGDFWLDSETGAWRLQSSEWVDERVLCKVWEYSVEGLEWKLLIQRPSGHEYVECSSVVEEFIHKGATISLATLLSRARVEHQLGPERARKFIDRQVRSSGRSSEIAYVPSKTVTDRGLRMRVHLGDSLHAIAPLLYVDESSGEERIVYSEAERCTRRIPSSDQVSFQTSGPYLLAGTEYSLQCARVVDMRTGKIVYRFPRHAIFVVWVPGFKD